MHKKGESFIVQFSNKDVVVCSTQVLDDSLMIRLYVSLPEGAIKPDTAATTHVLPLATLEEVFTENGDIIRGYTLSSSLAASISSDTSKWKDLFLGGGAAVIAFGFILTSVLCLGLVGYKWKQKKRQVTVWSAAYFDCLFFLQCEGCSVVESKRDI